MSLKINSFIKKNLQGLRSKRQEWLKKKRIKKYLATGRVPWTTGYEDFKYSEIKRILGDVDSMKAFASLKTLKHFGIGIDERIVEYPWIFSNLSAEKKILLDAGSTFNFEEIVSQKIIADKELTIFTYAPEKNNFSHQRISYQYGDLRNIPYRDNFFEEIVCQSTLEHIGMDNTIYSFKEERTSDRQEINYSYRQVVKELNRVLQIDGTLLLTFPYGEFYNYGYFQQFNREIVDDIVKILEKNGKVYSCFFKYSSDGWEFSSQENCDNSQSYNPHTGIGKGVDGAAHSRSICCLKFQKTTI